MKMGRGSVIRGPVPRFQSRCGQLGASLLGRHTDTRTRTWRISRICAD